MLNQKYKDFHDETMEFLQENTEAPDQILSVLTQILVKTYIAYYGAKDISILLEQTQDCFDHYQEIANVRRMD